MASRAKVACREARRADNPKRLARRCQDWITEVRMVEDIEHLGPELQVQPFGNLGVLANREVRIENSTTLVWCIAIKMPGSRERTSK